MTVRRRLIIALPLLAACYTWQPVRQAGPASGERVNILLSDRGTAEMAPALGPGVSEVEGDVVAADSTDLRLAVRQVANTRGVPAGWLGEGVSIPRPYMARVSQRRFSAGGTALMSGLAAATLYGIYRLLGGPGIFEGGSAGSGSGGR
jgi:hypothetical protein